jgi:hypothetical protein
MKGEAMSRVLGADYGVTVSPQGLYETSTTQKLRLGTKLVRGDRVFKYAKAGAKLDVMELAYYYDYGVSGWAVVPTATPAGSNQVYATIGALEGVAGNGAVAAHELEGGYVVIFKLKAGADNTDYTFQILDNTAVAAGGGTTLLTLEDALPYACTTSAYTEITGNPYSDVRTNYSGAPGGEVGGRGFLGKPMIDAAANEFCWLQTWGPAWLSVHGAIGSADYDQQVVAYPTGEASGHIYGTAELTKAQHIGFVLTRIAGGAETQGTPVIFLQISA